MSAPAWLHSGVEEMAFRASPCDKRFANVVRKPHADGPRIVCKGQMVGIPSVSLFLRVPPELVHKLKRLTDGNHTVAAWALLEEALCVIENAKQAVVVTIPDRSGD